MRKPPSVVTGVPSPRTRRNDMTLRIVLIGVAAAALAGPVLAYEETTETYDSYESSKKVVPPPPAVIEKKSTVTEEHTTTRPQGHVIEKKRTVEETAPPVVRQRTTETET